MKTEITLPHLDPDATKENVLKIALDAEKEDLDSLWALFYTPLQ